MGALAEAERSSAHLIWTLGPRRAFVAQLYSVDTPVLLWCCLGSVSYACCALWLNALHPESSSVESNYQGEAAVEWTIQVQTAAFGAVLLLNVLNLGMRQHLLPFKCNLLLLFINAVAFATDLIIWCRGTPVYPLSPGVLGLGLGSPAAAGGASGSPVGDRAFAPLRYVQWAHSTPTMIYMVALLAEVRGWELTLPVLCDVAMVLTGLAACCTVGLTKVFFTFVSFATFAVVLRYIHHMFDKTLRFGDVAADQRGTLRAVRALLLALWSAFPLVWLAADWRLVSPQVEAVAWGVCDYLAKAVFSSQLWQSNLTGVHVRREVALEAWEAHNRVEAVARLSSLLAQRDELLSTLSHELRTPLAGIVALTGSLYREVASAVPAAARTLGAVRATATCMLHIVTSTLDAFAGQRAERGGGGGGGGGGGSGSSSTASSGQDYSLAVALRAPEGAGGPAAASSGVVVVAAAVVVDLRPLVETVTSVLRPLAHDGVAVVAELPEGLPAVTADATRLNQVLYNLVGNALRFTSAGEVRVSARVLGPDGSVWRAGRDEGAAGAGTGSSTGADSPCAGPAASSSAAAEQGRRSEDFTCTRQVAKSPLLGARAGPGSAGLWRRRPRTSASSERQHAAPGGAGGPPLSAEAAAAALPPGCYVEVAVEDTGVGIPQAQLEALMAPTCRPLQGAADTAATAAAASAYAAAAAAGSGAPDVDLDDASARKRSNKSQRRAAQAEGKEGAGGAAAAAAAAVAAVSPGVMSIGGTGLGLYLVRLALRAQGSELTAESAAGIGSMFRFRLPVATAACAAAALAGSKQQQQGAVSAVPVPAQDGGVSVAREASVAWMASAGDSEGEPAPTMVATAPVVPPSEPAAIARLTCKVSGGSSSGGGGGGTDVSSSGTAPVAGGAGAVTRYAQSCCSPLAATGSMPGACFGDSGSGFGLTASAGASHAGGLTGRPPLERGLSCSACDGPGGLRAPSGISVVMAAGAAAAAAAAATACSAAGSVDGVPLSGGAGAGSLRARSSLLAAYPQREVLDVRSLAQADGPVAAMMEEQAGTGAGAVAAAPAANNFRHRNKGTLQVMSVDDDPINQLVAGQMLTSQQWKVVKCMDGPQALKFLRLPSAPEPRASASGGGATAAAAAADALAEALSAADAAAPPLEVVPDCVLLDVMMPGMTGFEVCRRLRRRYPHAVLPVIIVSAKADAAAVEEAFAAGADDYMTKPYKRAEMVARIKAQIRIRDSMVAAAAAPVAPVAPSAPPHQALARLAAQHQQEQQLAAAGPGATTTAAAAAAAARPGSADVLMLGKDLRVHVRAVSLAPPAGAAPAAPAQPFTPGSRHAGSLASLLGGAAVSESAATPPPSIYARRSVAEASPAAATAIALIAASASTPGGAVSAPVTTTAVPVSGGTSPPTGGGLGAATGAFGSRLLGESACGTENGMQQPSAPAPPGAAAALDMGAAAAAAGAGVFSATNTLTGTGQFRYMDDACASELALITTANSATATTTTMPPRAAAVTVAFVDVEGSGTGGGGGAGRLRAAGGVLAPARAPATSPAMATTTDGAMAGLSSSQLMLLPSDTASAPTPVGGRGPGAAGVAALAAAAAAALPQPHPQPEPQPGTMTAVAPGSAWSSLPSPVGGTASSVSAPGGSVHPPPSQATSPMLLAGSSPVPPPTGSTAASPAAAAAAIAAVAATPAAASPNDAASLMAELLGEMRRSRVLEADVAKLTARVAALQTACSTLAADRDGWRRQARDLRALMASGVAAATAAAASGGGAAAPPPSLVLGAGTAGPAYGGVAGFTSLNLPVGQPLSSAATASVVGRANSLLNEAALAAAYGSAASADSGNHALPPPAGGGAGGGSGGSVAMQLEDLRRETAVLRQQLRIAMASVGGGSGSLGGVAGGGNASGAGVPGAVQAGRLLQGMTGGGCGGTTNGGLLSTGASAGMSSSRLSSEAQMGVGEGAGAAPVPAPTVPSTTTGSGGGGGGGRPASSPQQRRELGPIVANSAGRDVQGSAGGAQPASQSAGAPAPASAPGDVPATGVVADGVSTLGEVMIGSSEPVAPPWSPQQRHHLLLPHQALFGGSGPGAGGMTAESMLLNTAGSCTSAASGARPHLAVVMGSSHGERGLGGSITAAHNAVGVAAAAATPAAASPSTCNTRAADADAVSACVLDAAVGGADADAGQTEPSLRIAPAVPAAAAAAAVAPLPATPLSLLPSGDVPTPSRANDTGADAAGGLGVGARRGGGGASAHAHSQLPAADAQLAQHAGHMGMTSLSSDLPPKVPPGNGHRAVAIPAAAHNGLDGSAKGHASGGCDADLGIVRGGVSGENSRGGSVPSAPMSAQDGAPKACDNTSELAPTAQPLAVVAPAPRSAAAAPLVPSASFAGGSGRDGTRGRSGGSTAGILRLLCSRGAAPAPHGDLDSQ